VRCVRQVTPHPWQVCPQFQAVRFALQDFLGSPFHLMNPLLPDARNVQLVHTPTLQVNLLAHHVLLGDGALSLMDHL
jgi:hypothetical protein